MGLDDYYHTFAAVLETNGVSPYQVLLEVGIDDFAHQDAGLALTEAVAKFPMSDTDASSDDRFQ
jgi:ribosomal protein L16/L10AE